MHSSTSSSNPFKPVATLAMLSVSMLLLSPAALFAAAPPTLSLPATLLGVQTSTTSPTSFTLAVSGVPAGSSLSNTTYSAWCVDPPGFVPGEVIDLTTFALFDPSGQTTYNVFSTYGTLPMDMNIGSTGPVDGGSQVLTVAQEYQLINYVLNNKKGSSGAIAATVTDIQAVIVQLNTHNTPFISYVTAPGTDAAALALYQDALANGIGFVPGSGQVVAVLLQAVTPANSPERYQNVIIEVPVNGTICITKKANKATAKCFETVTYTYTVTNTGAFTLSNIVVTDDNGTPNFDKDDFTAGTVASLAPGQSVIFTQTIYLPIRQHAYDSNNVENWSFLIPKCLPNGDIQVTFLEDADLIDNTYGNQSTAGWRKLGGHNFSDSVGTDYAEFQFTDTRGSTIVDFDVDYLSSYGGYASGYGTVGVHNGWTGWHAGFPGYVTAVKTSLTDALNQSAYSANTANSPPASDHNWEANHGYTVTCSKAAFGSAGFGGVCIKKVYNNKCKTGGGFYCPKPVCDTITNRATVKATVAGSTVVVVAKAQASVTLNAPCAPATQGGHRCQHPY